MLVRYLPYYTETEKHRHDVRPGLTGLAQINGRNAVVWDERFRYDVTYVQKISLKLDVAIVLKTCLKVFKTSGVQVRGTGKNIDFDKYRQNQLSENVKV